MRFLTIILISSLFCSAALADDQGVALLKKGDAAPFEGYLLTPEKAQNVRKLSLDLDYQTRLVALTNQENVLFQKRMDNCQTANEGLLRRVNETDGGWLAKITFFVMGAAVTSVIAYGAVRAVR